MSRHRTKKVNDTELRHARSSRSTERVLQQRFEEEEKQSARSRRQIDRQMLMARQELVDIKARTPSPSRYGPIVARIPDITVNEQIDDQSSTSSLRNVSEDEQDSGDEHLEPRTKRNLALSKKLSRSLEVMTQKRQGSPHREGSAHGPEMECRRVSPRAMDDLQRAAQVLKYTEHEDTVQQLLASVTSSSRT